MNLHKKVGGIPLPVILGVIAGGLVLGIYLRHRAKKSTATTTDPVGTYSTAAGGGGIADPNGGLNGDLIALLQQQGDALTAALLTLAPGSGGGGSVPAAAAPAPAPAPSSPTVSVASSGGSGASPNAGEAPPAISDPTFASPAPPAVNLFDTSTYPSSIAPQLLDPAIGAALIANGTIDPTSAFAAPPASTSTGPSGSLFGTLDPGIATALIAHDVPIPAVYNPAPMPARGSGKAYAS